MIRHDAVYCRDCKYIRKWIFGKWGYRCRLYKDSTAWYDGKIPEATVYEFCATQNKHNNCQFYEPKKKRGKDET